jgi:hypothetical protein
VVLQLAGRLKASHLQVLYCFSLLPQHQAMVIPVMFAPAKYLAALLRDVAGAA